jgi:foldase protein PrsA
MRSICSKLKIWNPYIVLLIGIKEGMMSMRETIRRWPLVLLALLAVLILTPGCMSDPDPSPVHTVSIPTETIAKDETIAKIGNVDITRQQLLDQLLSTYGAQTLRGLMLSEAVKEEAKTFGIIVTDDELTQELHLMSQGYEDEQQFYKAMEQQLNMSREEVLEDARYRLVLEKLSIRDVNVTQSEIDLYLEQHRDEFEPRKQFRIAHIVVENKEEAKEIVSQLAGGTDFGVLARSHSLDEFTADDAGDLGWVEDLDPFEAPEVLQAAASMEVGEMAGPIQTEQGYEIVQLNGRKEMGSKSNEAIRMEVWRQLALGKAVSMKDMEQSLLDKYNAKVMEPSLQPDY